MYIHSEIIYIKIEDLEKTIHALAYSGFGCPNACYNLDQGCGYSRDIGTCDDWNHG